MYIFIPLYSVGGIASGLVSQVRFVDEHNHEAERSDFRIPATDFFFSFADTILSLEI